MWCACLKKREGLGLRNLTKWNSILLLCFIWLLFSQSGSLWVAWFRYHKLRYKSFWFIDEGINDSWSWKTLIRMRPLAEKFVKCLVGNGHRASFWHDSWTQLGPVIKRLGLNGPRQLGIPVHSTVASACNRQGWLLREPHSEFALELHILLTTINLPSFSNMEDHYTWEVNGHVCSNFSSSITWEALRPRQPTKLWTEAILFKGATPAHAFLMLTAQLDRLPTMTRLASWGLNVDIRCCFCSANDENRDHILLRCEFSDFIWRKLQYRLGVPPFFFTPGTL